MESEMKKMVFAAFAALSLVMAAAVVNPASAGPFSSPAGEVQGGSNG
jgi:hypothetical protein